ncbi:hypothetical protein BD770DRAFT_327020, partial [Pilaira anomala]
LWILYSNILWIIYIVYYLYALKDQYYDDMSLSLLCASPIFLGPFCIFYVRKGIKWIVNKRLTSIETSLISLRKQQKLKVDELKKNTAYYSTKSLIDRYDPTSPEKKILDEQRKRKLAQEKEEEKRRKGPMSQGPTMGQQGPMGQAPGAMIGKQGVMPLPMTQQTSQPWYDKMVDALVGDVGPETKYALICRHCNAHNGLVLPQEIETIEYTCPHCHQFNPSRKSQRYHHHVPPVEHNLGSQEDFSILASNEDKLRQRKPTTPVVVGEVQPN